MFEVNADGASKTVSVVALGLEDMEPNADTAIKQAMAELGARLRDFDAGGTLGSTLYEPAAYRGILTPAEGLEGVTFIDWPWSDLTPADFALPEDPMVLQQGKALLTPEQAAAVGVDGVPGRDPRRGLHPRRGGPDVHVRAAAAAPERDRVAPTRRPRTAPRRS